MSEASGNRMDGAEEMDEFERALAKAMQRVDAPETLVQFLTLATEVKRESVLPWRKRRHKFAFVVPGARMWVGGAVAAVLVLGVFGAELVHVRREREKAEIATRQFEAATRITDQALRQTREQLARAGVSLE